jgi:hypothetical protein
VQPLILFNDRRNYVAADVFDPAQVNALHPRKVAAGDIEQHTRSELAKRIG